MPNRVTIKLDTEIDDVLIPIISFKLALDELTTILHEVELEISDAKRSKLKWGIVELSLGSATVGIEDVTEERELAERTTRSAIEGLSALKAERVRPKYFNDTALESAQKLSRLVHDSVSKINIYSDIPNLQTYVSDQVAVNVTDILEHIEFLGSVEGLLELISGREGQPLYFRIRDVVTSAGVRCFFPDEMLTKALDAFRKRVIVYGYIQSDNSGNPRKIRVQDMELLPMTIIEFKHTQKFEDCYYGSN